jgi:hypothetical protein
MMGITSYAVVSTLATIACICHAFNQERDYYPALISLATSKVSVTALGNMSLVVAILFGSFLRKLFLGRLRAAEVDFPCGVLCACAFIVNKCMKYALVYL